MTYPVGSIVKIYGTIYIKTSYKMWDAYNVEYEWSDEEVTKYFEEFSEEEIEVLRKPTPKDTLRALPVGSVVAGGLYGAVARKTDENEWAVSLREWAHDSEEAADYLSKNGEISVLSRGGEG